MNDYYSNNMGDYNVNALSHAVCCWFISIWGGVILTS